MSLDTANLNLIYDRTESDKTASATIRKSYQTLGNWSGLTDAERAQLERGALTYNTLNRVESAVKLLAAALTSAGYPVEVTPVLKGSSRVPTGYTEVEWIQSSGTQYIDSGVTETADMAVSCHFDVDTVASDYLLGSQQNNSNLSYNGIYKNNMLEYNYTEIGFTAANSIELAEEITGTTAKLTVNGVSHTASTGTPQNVSMLIFGIRRNTGAMRPYGGQAKLRYFKIKKGSNTVRDFVPCKNPAGTVGLYDLVGGKFYTTPTASALPAGYTPVEYLQSNGLQYIDTGIDVTPSNYSQLKFAVTCEKIGQGQGQSGWLVDGSNVSNAYFYMGTYNGKYYYGCGTTDHNTNIDTTSGKQTYVLDIPAKKFTVSGSVDTSITTEAITASASLYLFGFDYSPVRAYAEKIYASQIYNNGTLVRNFVPARNSSGTLGLYDTVNGAFYTNAGSGTFTAGADIVGFTAGAEVGKAEDREWQEGDVLYRPQWTTYLDNVQRLRDAYYTLAETGALPAPEDKLKYTGANTIEKVLADIDLLLDGMKSIYRQAGTFSAGGNYIRQMIRSI
jgi:hypothetical protein